MTKRKIKVGDPMTGKEETICRSVQAKIADALMEGQMASGGAAVPLTAMGMVFAYALASLYETADDAMAHLDRVLRPEIEKRIAEGVRKSNTINVHPEAGHA